jgi:hypothetical protein
LADLLEDDERKERSERSMMVKERRQRRYQPGIAEARV